MTTEHMQRHLKKTRAQSHAGCIVCDPDNDRGLGLEFTVSEDGGVETVFGCEKAFQGYGGLLHGGVISSILDGARTSCMFAHGRSAVTAQLDTVERLGTSGPWVFTERKS